MGNFWKNHGTKIIGSLTTLLGAITVATPDTLTGIFGTRGPAIATAAAGILTIWRGFYNSNQAPK
jgi:hypothetical protein